MRVDNDPESKKSVVEVFNHSPFPYKNRNYMSVNGQKLFEIFNTENGAKGFLNWLNEQHLNFFFNSRVCTRNWSG